jgi:hypothetical protein
MISCEGQDLPDLVFPEAIFCDIQRPAPCIPDLMKPGIGGCKISGLVPDPSCRFTVSIENKNTETRILTAQVRSGLMDCTDGYPRCLFPEKRTCQGGLGCFCKKEILFIEIQTNASLFTCRSVPDPELLIPDPLLDTDDLSHCAAALPAHPAYKGQGIFPSMIFIFGEDKRGVLTNLSGCRMEYR